MPNATPGHLDRPAGDLVPVVEWASGYDHEHTSSYVPAQAHGEGWKRPVGVMRG